MTNITKERYNEVLEYFGDKTLSFGCEIEVEDNWENKKDKRTFVYKSDGKNFRDGRRSMFSIQNGELLETIGNDDFKILGHPVFIGDVLEKINKKFDTTEDYSPELRKERREKLWNKWQPCGFSSSLQEIVEGGWEEVSKCCGARACWNFVFKSCDKCGKRFEPNDIEILKQPQADLISFLHNLIPSQ